MTNFDRVKEFAAGTAILAAAFGAVYSVVWLIYTKAPWVAVAGVCVLIAAAVPTIIKLIKYIFHK